MFKIDTVDDGGRSGFLDINGFEIESPSNIITQTDLFALQQFREVSKGKFDNLRVLGIQNKWITVNVQSELKKQNNFETFLEGLNKTVPKKSFKTKILNYEFPKYINRLNPIVLINLLKTQVELKPDVLQIPNFLNNLNYSRVLDDGIKYFKENGDGQPVMALACNHSHFKPILDRMSKIDCVGVNFKEEAVIPRLIVGIRDLLRKNEKRDIWVHAFSTPRSYETINLDGTPGIGINRFNIDTISFPVGQGYATPTREAVFNHRYYNPLDYGTHQWKFMVDLSDGDLNLSDFCGCPYCENNTMVDVIKDYAQEPSFSRAHEAISYHNESQKLRDIINSPSESSLEYIDSKQFAQEYFSKLT